MNVNSTSSVSSNNGFSGMISGMDTDSLVEKLLSGTQSKIDKQKGLKTQTEWKIENYRDVITQINSFSSKYFNTTYGASAKNNLSSSAFFNAMTSKVISGNAVKVVSSAAGASTEDMNIIVKQLASKAKLTSSVNVSGESVLKGGKIDTEAIKSTINETGEFTFTLTLDGAQKAITLKKEDLMDADGNITEDAVISALETEVSQKFGGYIKVNVAEVDGAKNISLAIDFNGEKGHELKVTGANASALGLVPGASTRISTSSKLSELGLTGDSFSFEINGEKFSFTAENTVADVISAVNKSDAGVKLSYSSISDSFSMEATESGAKFGINITETSGNFLSKIFGSDKFENGALKADAVVAGQDAIVSINGNEFSRTSNNFTIDGVTLQLTDVSAAKYDGSGNVIGYEETKITTERDTESILETIKSFVEDYNKMLDKLNGYIYEEPNYRKYAPLTDAQRDEMTESQIEKWEEKSKQGLLYGDSTIRNFLQQMRGALYTKSTTSSVALYNIGIETSSNKDDRGKLVIDEEALKKALETNADEVEKLFVGENGLAEKLTNIMDRTAKVSAADPGELVRIAGAKESKATQTQSTLYNELKRIDDRISILNTRYNKEKDRYWKQFNAMETIISNYSSQSAYLGQQFTY
ncbi:MAG: flagellar filament capping protein FliD [Clostridia bacterium]|nr:flagellar filament capping protein FliD [Clostridia bacterium]MBR3809442.1 flagellar filament capping protein FliD [Clostridia bacterium]